MTALHFLQICQPNKEIQEVLSSKLFEGIDFKKLVIQRDSLGRTPLLLAVANSESPEEFKILLEWGSDTNIPDNNGETPIFFAFHTDDDEPCMRVELLTKHGKVYCCHGNVIGADLNWCNHEDRPFWIDFIQNINFEDYGRIKEKVDADKAFKIFQEALKKKKIKTMNRSDDLVDCSGYAWEFHFDWPENLHNTFVESHGDTSKYLIFFC